jgi:hypothetical protein
MKNKNFKKKRIFRSVFSHPTFLGLVHTMVLRVPITSCHLASIGRESPDVQWKLGSGRPLEGFRGDVAVADHSSVCSHKRRCCVLRRALGISLRSCYLCRDSAIYIYIHIINIYVWNDLNPFQNHFIFQQIPTSSGPTGEAVHLSGSVVHGGSPIWGHGAPVPKVGYPWVPLISATSSEKSIKIH